LTACCLAPQDSAENTRNRLYLLPYCALLRRQSDIPPLAAAPILPELPDNSGNPDRPVANGFGGYDYVCIGSRMRRLSAMALGMAGPSGELAAIPPK
jgi:hypothetical protein